MARKKSRIYGFPTAIYVEGVLYSFDQVAPITGDGVYRHEESSGSVSHAIVLHPDARRNQLQHFHRGI